MKHSLSTGCCGSVDWLSINLRMLPRSINLALTVSCNSCPCKDSLVPRGSIVEMCHEGSLEGSELTWSGRLGGIAGSTPVSQTTVCGSARRIPARKCWMSTRGSFSESAKSVAWTIAFVQPLVCGRRPNVNISGPGVIRLRASGTSCGESQDKTPRTRCSTPMYSWFKCLAARCAYRMTDLAASVIALFS